MSAILLPGIAASMTVMGSTPYTVMLFFFHVVPFFIATWEERETHMMRFGVLGPTEAQLTHMSFALISGVFGAEFFAWAPLGLFQLNHFCCIVAIFFCAYVVAESVMTVVGSVPDPAKALKALVPFAVFCVSSAVWMLAPSGLFQAHGRLLLFTCGIMCVQQVSELIVSSISKTEYKPTIQPLIALPLIALNSMMPALGLLPIVQEVPLAYFFCLCNTGYFLYFAVSIVQEIATYLGLSVFTIDPRQT